MCTVSMVGDYYSVKFEPYVPSPWLTPVVVEVRREEFDQLKREVEDLKGLLSAARKYDAENGQEGCETDEKMRILRAVAEKVGVDLGELA